MAVLSVFFAEEAEWDPDLLEHEAIDKGYRRDVIVGVGQQYYYVAVYTIQRLAQDFETEQESYGYYTPDPNLIFVPEASRRQIVETIRTLHERTDLFARLKPTDEDMVEKVSGLPNHA